LYAIQQQQQQQQQQIKLLQKFPNEHSSSHWISCFIHINQNTLISSSSYWSSSDSSNVIVIWSKSSSKSSSSLYEPMQRITPKETGLGVNKLVLLSQKKEEEEAFASCSFGSIIIWKRGQGQKEFQIKQKIVTNVKNVRALLYISLTNELIFAPSSSLLQIWKSHSSFSDFVEKQTIQETSRIESLYQLNEKRNDSRIEFVSGYENGKICIWSKQQINGSKYSLIRTLQPFNHDNDLGSVNDLIFINHIEFNFLIACSKDENKIKLFKEGEEVEELEHKGVGELILMSNGVFASGGSNQFLNIWSPSSSS
jgi:hypothetical protein